MRFIEGGLQHFQELIELFISNTLFIEEVWAQ